MADTRRTRLVVANAINFITEINEVMLENARKRRPTQLVLPDIVQLAYMLRYEDGVLPMVDTLEDNLS